MKGRILSFVFIIVLMASNISCNTIKDGLEKNVQESTKETPVKETPIIETPIIETPIIETPAKETPSKEGLTTTAANTPIKEADVFEPNIIEKEGLVELIKLDNSFVLDIKYATEDNFAKKQIYSVAMCLIHKNTAKKLIAANNEFKTLGYRLKIFDAYRPYSVQQVLWDSTDEKAYVAHPQKGSKHNRGASVDVTLVDENGQELEMPSGYDEFSERAHLNYDQCDEQVIKNRELLGEVMVKHGFKRISTEWWHFDDTDAESYPLLDISFEQFIDDN